MVLFKIKCFSIKQAPKATEAILIINKILEFFNHEYLNIWIWFLSNNFIKNNWVEIKKINGNNSNKIEGEFIIERYNVKNVVVSIFLKNSNSPKKFTIITKLKTIRDTNINDRKKILDKNFIYVFICFFC